MIQNTAQELQPPCKHIRYDDNQGIDQYMQLIKVLLIVFYHIAILFANSNYHITSMIQ